MNLEERLQIAKQFKHHNIQVDLDKFEARLFQRLAQENRPKRKSFKWKFVSIVAAAILIPSAAYASTMLNVNKETISVPAYHYEKIAKLRKFSEDTNNVQKVYSLSEARAVSKFSIREPETIDGWNRDVSKGIHFKHGLETSKTSGVDQYMDVYTNSQGQQITVTQSGNLDAQDEKNTKFNEHGVYSQLIADKEGKLNTLMIIIKEKNNTLTHIQIIGDASEADLLSIGEAYIQAPTN